MVSFEISSVVALALTLQFRLALAIGTDDQVNAYINYGTFADPSVYVRPRLRYWPPDASVNLTQVAEDVRQAGRVGAGGVELLGYYLYGNQQLFPGTYDLAESDWTVYYFGSPAWNTLLETVLSTAQEEGLQVDMSLGPNQGAGVPAPWDSDGLLWDLSYDYAVVPIGGTFDGVLPGWGSGKLVAASTGLVLSIANFTTGGSNTTLAQASLRDITGAVASDGTVTVSFDSPNEGIEYRVLAYYLKHSLQTEVEPTAKTSVGVPQSPIKTYQQNGSWVVDHFSALGAQTTIDFWENNTLDENIMKLIKEVGNYVWEDSQEFYILENTFWTPELASAFFKNRGYSVNKYVPLLYNTLTSSSDTVDLYILDTPDAGHVHVEDYRQTLTELNQIYLATLSDWAQRTLGMQFSAQVVYNLPMDMLANIPCVNAPECETLAFGGNIDGYRQYAGPANLAGKRVISSESGAQFGDGYQQTVPQVIRYFKSQIAGGINQFVIHGYPYSGNYGNTTWPGFTTFDYTVSEMHGRHQPGWDFYPDFMDWTARSQWVAQTGIPKIDLAFWSKRTDYRSYMTGYEPSDLIDAGFSYEYLSPDNFDLPDAYVSHGVLAPERQAFKALIIPADERLTALGVAMLSKYARAGLPVIFYGGLPHHFEGYDRSSNNTMNGTMALLATLHNVHITPPGFGLAAFLDSIHITPRTSVKANNTWYTYWRESDGIDYVYIYNENDSGILGGGASNGTIMFETVGVPFFYDAWTGDITPVLCYSQTHISTTIPLSLAGDQATILAFKKFHPPWLHVESSNLPAETLGIKNSSSSISILRSYIDEPTTVTLSNGSSMTLQPMLERPFTLDNWTLIVESWTPPANIYDLNPDAVRTNLTTFTNIQKLVPWTSIDPTLTYVSGRGYYSTEFSWPPTHAEVYGAFIDLGPIIHTARLIINGHHVHPLDVTHARADITEFLVYGSNEVDVIVSTPLGNALNPIWDSLQTTGRTAASANANPPSIAEYGLVFDVRIEPYREDLIY